jgi:hypothetical protein
MKKSKIFFMHRWREEEEERLPSNDHCSLCIFLLFVDGKSGNEFQLILVVRAYIEENKCNK